MATRSTIGILEKDGTVSSIYCHWDGYLKNNGKILLENYNTEERVRELISLGSLSSLGKEIGTDLEHSFENPVEDVCVAYHRDRGEELRIFQHHSKDSFLRNGEDYNYLFDSDSWKVGTDSGFYTLQLEDCK